MKTQRIIPAIIPDSFEHLKSRLRDVRGVARRVQVDVMDGSYAPPHTWPYVGAHAEAVQEGVRGDVTLPYWQEFDFEIDLLLSEPERKIEEWALAGASTVIIHAETTDRIDDIMRDCRERRVEVGIAIKPSYDIEALAPYVGQALFVQVMGNERVGYHGVSLQDEAVEKIRALHARWPSLQVGVDIGVSQETLPTLCEAGARRFAAGSAVFGFTSPEGAYLHLEDVVSKHVASYYNT